MAHAPSVYDFRRPAPLAHEHDRLLRSVFEDLGGRLTPVLSSRLRTPAKLSLRELEVVSGTELAEVTSTPALFVLVQATPLPGSFLLRLELGAARVIVDVLLGGNGSPLASDAPLSTIERRLAGVLFDRFVEPRTDAWSKLLPLTPVVDAIHSDPEDLQLGITGEPALHVEYTLELLGETHALHLYLEGVTLAAVLKRLPRPTPQVLIGRPHRDPRARDAVAGVVRTVPVELRVVLPEQRINSGRVMTLAPGDVISLSCGPEDPVPLQVGGIEVGTVRPARSGNRLACQVVSVTYGRRGAAEISPTSTTNAPGRAL